MAKFSKRSLDNLSACHPDLQRLFKEIIKYRDISILCGHRSKKDQDSAFLSGNSKLRWPNSAHNKKPSLAVDVVPFPLNWEDRESFVALRNFVKGVASQMGIQLRADIEWDLPHFEKL